MPRDELGRVIIHGGVEGEEYEIAVEALARNAAIVYVPPGFDMELLGPIAARTGGFEIRTSAYITTGNWYVIGKRLGDELIPSQQLRGVEGGI